MIWPQPATRPLAGAALLLTVVVWARAGADEFERLDGSTIRRLTAAGGGAQVIAQLPFPEIAAMPARLADSRSALVLARSDQGNLVRLLLRAELHQPTPPRDVLSMAPAMRDRPSGKPAAGPDPALEPIPVVVVERLDSFDAGNPAQRLASRREVTLWAGLPIDLDSGQVVPADPRFGADLVLRSETGQPPRLEPIGTAQLFGLSQPLPPEEATALPRPTPGRTIVPSDFAGRFQLFANGQWSGVLDLRVGGRGVVTGQFRSDLHGSAYPVTGQLATDAPGRLRFAVALPRARQEFDGYLFGEGKGAIAGTVSLLERTFGFFAVRQGGRLSPEGVDLGPTAPPAAARPGRVVLERLPDGATRLEDQVVPLATLAEALQRRAASAPADAPIWLEIRAAAATHLADLKPLIEAAEAVGINDLRLVATP